MKPIRNLSQAKQVEIIKYVKDTYTRYDQQTTEWREKMLDIYQQVTSFNQWSSLPRETNFKINKLHEIENRILPRVMSKSPKPIVQYISDDYIDNENIDIKLLSEASEDRLNDIYKNQDMIESLRLRAKAGIRYGLWFAKIVQKYRLWREYDKKENEYLDEEGNVIKEVDTKVKEKIYKQYTWIEIKSRSDMYFDPRYTRFEDMPNVIDITKNVRLSYFTKQSDKYINIDKLIDCCSVAQNTRFDDYVQTIYAITWIQDIDSIMKPETLEIKCYYGYYDLSDDKTFKNEKLYEFWTVNDAIIVYACEITTIPFEDFRVFEDTETFFATWLLEPIIWLQKEMNWKKNRASEYINKMLKPDYIRSPQSWIDPRKINQWHWNVLITTKDGQTALNNFIQMPMRELPSSYFNEQNDIERQIQAASFTVNTNNPLSQNSLTNTATGAKIQAFETDAVTAEIRWHFEEALVRLSYKILQTEYDNLTENIRVIKKDKSWYREINKEALKDATNRYDITIEVWSSSSDYQDERRNDAIAQRNIALQGANAWLPIDLKKKFTSIMQTFDGNTDWLFTQSDPSQLMQPPMQWQPPMQPPVQEPVPMKT